MDIMGYIIVKLCCAGKEKCYISRLFVYVGNCKGEKRKTGKRNEIG